MFRTVIEDLSREKLQASIIHHQRVEFDRLQYSQQSLFGPIRIERNIRRTYPTGTQKSGIRNPTPGSKYSMFHFSSGKPLLQPCCDALAERRELAIAKIALVHAERNSLWIARSILIEWQSYVDRNLQFQIRFMYENEIPCSCTSCPKAKRSRINPTQLLE